MKKQGCLIWVFLVILGLLNIYCVYYTIASHISNYDEAVETYIVDSQRVIEMIEDSDENFQDTFGGTDEYNNYLYSKEKIDSLFNE